MILKIPRLLTPAALAEVRALISGAAWIDGRATAGHASAGVKRNRQLDERDPQALKAGAIIISALEAHETFISAALPARIVPPLFNLYADGETYGAHIDGAIRPLPGHALIRTDLSATLFLSDPDDYDGGELCIRQGTDETRLRPEAGDMILYSAGTVHHVVPVTRGERIAAFFWVQSLVRDTTRREMLHDLDRTIQRLAVQIPDAPELIDLHGHYHNLLRQWAEP